HAELAVAVVAPAAHVAGVEERAGVPVARGDGANRTAAALHGRGEGIAHLVWVVAVGERAERRAELVGRVVAPALRLRVVEQRARERAADGDRAGAPTRPEIDRRRGRRGAIPGVAEAELAAVVLPPASDAVI